MGFKFNPFTGTLDIVKGKQFSYKVILNGTTLTIPENQQMVLVGQLTINGDGQLILSGNAEVALQ